MNTTLTIPLGTATLTIHADDPKEALEQGAVFLELPPHCPLCHSSVRPFFRRTPDKKGKIWPYWGMVCDGPTTHENTFGQHADDDRLFYKARAWIVKPTSSGATAPDTGELATPAAPVTAAMVPGPAAAQPAPKHSGPSKQSPAISGTTPQDFPLKCSFTGCARALTTSQRDLSVRNFGAPLCPACQKKPRP